MFSKLCLPRDMLGLTAPGCRSWGGDGRHRGQTEGRGGCHGGSGEQPGLVPMEGLRASRGAAAGSGLRLLPSPQDPNLYQSWAPTPLHAGGPGFRIWFTHRNRVVGWFSAWATEACFTLKAVAPRSPGPGPHHSSPPQQASSQSLGLQAENRGPHCSSWDPQG